MVKAEAENSVGGTPAEVKPATGLSEGPESRPSKRTSLVRRVLNVFLRLFVWYILITAVFRCPSSLSDLDDSSHRVCKPYLIGRSYLEPHIAPYYNTYGAPYVDAVRPYAETLNHQVYTPIASFSKSSYQNYAAPRVAQSLQAAEDNWDAVVAPKLQSIKAQSLDRFDAAIKPHFAYLESLIVPHYQSAAAYGQFITDGYIMPTYTRSKPFLERSYLTFHDFSTKTLIPFTCKAWSSTITFVTGTLRTQITTLYTENVEPQLVRIGEKLASYREGRKWRPTVEDNESTIDTPEPTAETSLASEVTETTVSSMVSTTSESPSETRSPPSQSPESVREQIITDLKSWQQRFAVAADKGCQDLEEQITGVVQGLSDEDGKTTGERLVTQLETVTNYELNGLKQTINGIISSMPDLPTSEEEDVAHEEVIQFLKSSGLAIRDAAHALREWYSNYDGILVSEVDAAVSTTLDVLDNIRDLGLQEIGMRWAWLDGVTYKDWAKFHALKKRFSEWRDEVRDIGTQNSAFVEARSIASDIVSRGMDIAEKAAKDLSALREIGTLKIQAGDSSDNFEVELIDPDVIQTRRNLIREREIASEVSPEGILQYSTDNGSEHADTVGEDMISDGQSTESHGSRSTSTEVDSQTVPADVDDYPHSMSTSSADSDATSATDLAGPSSSVLVEESAEDDDFEKDNSEANIGNSCEECDEDTTEFDIHSPSDSFKIPDDPALPVLAQVDDLTQEPASEEDDNAKTTASEPPVISTSTETSDSSPSDTPLESVTSSVAASLESDLSKVSELYSEAVNEATNFDSDDVQETLEDIQRRRDEAIALALEQYSSAMKAAAHTPSASKAVPDSEESSYTASSSSTPSETIIYSGDEEADYLADDQKPKAETFEPLLDDEDSSEIEFDELVGDDATHFEEMPSATFDSAQEAPEVVLEDESVEQYPTEQFHSEL